MQLPNKEGHYWAKWKIPSPGTHEGEHLTPSDRWEIVQVWENYVGEPREDVSKFGVSVPGVRETQWPDQFYWGPMVAVPDSVGLEVL